ncbi:MAG: hypothetical protein Crog3KO_01590 [Crocinitomicaceae bacterium]
MNEKEKTFGAFIDWDTAKQLISSYNQQPTKWKDENDDTISALRIDIDSLKDILDNKIIENAQDLIIVLGHNNGRITTPNIPNPRTGFTTILMAVDSNNDMIITANDGIADFLDTCPSVCPNKIDGKQLHEW